MNAGERLALAIVVLVAVFASGYAAGQVAAEREALDGLDGEA